MIAGASAASVAAACSTRPGKDDVPRSSPDASVEGKVEFDAREGSAALGAVTRLGPRWETSDPFLFCAHHDDSYPAGNEQLGPQDDLQGRRLGRDFAGKDGWRMYHGRTVPGFPRHPHRGFETVTVVRSGLLDHSDSLGARARYGDGDVQWLTAGQGINHAEMFPLLASDAPNPFELFQIWLNLPRANKMVPPAFKMLWDETVPRHRARDAQGREVTLTMVAGAYGEIVPPAPPPDSYAAQADSDVAIWTIKLEPGAQWILPAATEGTHRSLYFFRGSGIRVGGQAIPDYHRVELRGDARVAIKGGTEVCELLLLQGRPIGEPVARHGPFVMNTQDEIRQAYADYRSTGFGGWPWDGDDPVHGPESERFAELIDGSRDQPA